MADAGAPEKSALDTTESEPVALCTKGLLARVSPKIEGLNSKLKSLESKQIHLADKLSAESERFQRGQQEADVGLMIEKTR